MYKLFNVYLQVKVAIFPFFPLTNTEAVRQERAISNAKLVFAERDQVKPVLLRLSLARNLEKPLMSLYRTPNGGSVTMDSVFRHVSVA
jgi:hypothetical protein